MKKLYLFIIALVTITAQSWAYDFSAVAPSGHTLYYNIVNGNAEVTYQSYQYLSPSYTYITGSLTIPSSVTHNNTTYSVTSIGTRAFYYCTGLTLVTIPNTVTSIGQQAFQNTGITSITIPNSVTSIGNHAFAYCTSISSIIVESNNEVYDNRNSCNAIIETSTNTLVFGCKNSIIPNTVTTIGNYAFENCIGLTSITIPNSVTSIGADAFCECSGLTSVIIGNAVTSIGNNAFSGCNGLLSVYYMGDVAGWCGIDFVDNPLSYAQNLFIDNALVTDLVIPDSVTAIKPKTFLGATCLTSITIPNSVTSIGDGAFTNCSGLTSITIPNTVTSIGEWAFAYCSGLAEIHSLNPVPPAAGYAAFHGISTDIPIYIPCGSFSNYYSATDDWLRFYNFIENGELPFSVSSDNDIMGTVQILTMPTCTNPQAVILASANSGYRFDHWSDGNTANPYSLTITEDTELIGYFVPDGGSNGIDDVETAGNLKIYTRGNSIVIDFSGQQAAGSRQSVVLYDVMGRVIKQAAGSGQQAAVEIPVTAAGVYMVKVGDQPSRKVVVR